MWCPPPVVLFPLPSPASSGAVGFRHVFPCPANLSQHFAAFVARLVRADPTRCKDSRLLFSSKSQCSFPSPTGTRTASVQSISVSKNKKPAVNFRWLANSRMLDLLAAQGLAG